ncbi:MAG: ATP-binding protein [Pseudobdellovibrionaceae bacterium]|nr:ATP-binding protein [Bdellovibrionales bacterium]USN47258.1 MAG: ATP-binding protein [Pseudobdellovibrionaceae bacterium]
MVKRIIKFNKNNSLLLFGARGTGKTTFIQKEILPLFDTDDYWYFDLLKAEIEDRFLRDPDSLESEFLASKIKPKVIIIDEIQKVPKLLDLAHRLIESHQVVFVLTGSSARKLKQQSANLLAGRAFSERLFPLTHRELGDHFNLEQALNFGTLPSVCFFEFDDQRHNYLRTYALAYVKEEVQLEQLVRKLKPFREFLEIAAQMSGKIVNASKVAKDVGVDDKTVHSYYDILVDTYLGFYLPPFHRSVRKSQRKSPKFYLFDCGVKRALERSLHAKVVPGTSYYGDTFEQFIICEIFRLNEYLHQDYRISYFETTAGGEVDIVLSRGPKETLLVEIKSSEKIDEIEVKKLASIQKEFMANKAYYLSNDPIRKEVLGVNCVPWSLGLDEIFPSKK